VQCSLPVSAFRVAKANGGADFAPPPRYARTVRAEYMEQDRASQAVAAGGGVLC
jgi:hypothetical protein